MAQYLRPDSTVSAGSWTGDYTDVDEVTPADGDYTETNKAASTHQMTLSNPASTPGSGTCTVRWRGRRRLTNKSAEVTIEIWNGTTAMVADATQTQTDPSSTFTTWDTLTFSTADVTDWNDLQVRLVASPTPAVDFDVSWIEVEVPDGAATITKTVGLAAALERQNILRTASADAGLRATFTHTTDLAALLAGHVHLSTDLAAAIQRLQSATVQADAAVSAALELAVDFDARVELAGGTATVQTDIDAALARVQSAQSDVDAALSALQPLTVELAAVLQATGTVATDTDAALSARDVRVTDLDAALSILRTLSADLDAAALANRTRTADLDAAALANRTRTADLDAVSLASQTRTADLDARLVAAGVTAVYADVDAVLRRAQLAQTALDAGLALTALRTADIDARITVSAATLTVQADFDAAVRALLFAVTSADAAVKRTGVYTTANIDARLYDATAYVFPTPGRTLDVSTRRRGIPVPARARLVTVDDDSGV